MMEAIMGYIRDHFGEILTVVALIAAVYFGVKSRRSISACYYIYTDRLIGPMGSVFEGLEIVYEGISIHSFASSKVFLWNRGTEVIRREDIAPTAPLAINLHAPERALDYNVVYCSSPHSKVGIEPQEDECLLVSFDFLNPGDGCVLEILHTGDIGSLSMSGHIIGGGDIRKIDPMPEGDALNMVLGIFAIVVPVFVIAGTFILPTWIDTAWDDPTGGWLFLTPLIALFVSLPLISRKLVVWWSGGAVFKKLGDGYAKQQAAGQNVAAWNLAAWHVAAFGFAVIIVAVVGFMLGVFSGSIG